MSFSRPCHRHAFTLIELLVVISIISMLVAVLLPALSSARSASRNVQCLANLKQVGVGMHAYANEQGGYLVTWPTVAGTSKVNFTLDYLGASKVIGVKTALTCPEDRYFFTRTTYATSYGINRPLANGKAWSASYVIPRRRVEQFPFPTRSAAWGDNAGNGEWTYYGPSASPSAQNPETVFRHKQDTTANVLFVDGHAETRLKPRIPSRHHYPSAAFADAHLYLTTFWSGDNKWLYAGSPVDPKTNYDNK